MARPLRNFVLGLTLHVTQRGNNRCPIFRAPSDYTVFALVLRSIVIRYGLRIHAYVLMTNHFHLMVTPESESALPGAMQALGRRYIRFFNDRYERTGGLWEGRYKVAVIHDERYWLTCMRYVELNPVRAGLTPAPEAYEWSSYRAHGFGEPDPLLASHAVYAGLGETPDIRQQVWRGICGFPVTIEQLETIRMAIRRGFVAGEPVLVEGGSGT